MSIFALALSNFASVAALGDHVSEQSRQIAVDSPYSSSAKTSSSVDDFYFDDLTVDYYLEKTADGTSKMRVREAFVAVFPEADVNHGFNRAIPFTNQDGRNLTMASPKHLDITVTRNGQPENINNISAQDGYFEVQIGDKNRYVHGRQTYVLEYEFINVITDFDSYQELYWDVNGTDSRQDFNQVTARVHFDDATAQAFTGQSWCYTGQYGETAQNCHITELDDGVSISASNLSSYEGLTFDLEFAPGSFVVPEPPQYNYTTIILLLVEIFIFAAIGVLCYLNRRRFREPYQFYQHYFIKPEYTPPAGYTINEVFTNYLPATKGNLMTITLLDLAVNHKIELINPAKKKWQIRVKSLDMTPEQKMTLTFLLGNKDLQIDQIIELKKLVRTSSDYQLLTKFARNTKQNLVQKGCLYAKKDSSHPKNYSNLLDILAAVCLLAFWLISGIIIDQVSEVSYGAPLFGGIVLPIGMIILAFVFAVIISIYNEKTTQFSEHTLKGLELSRYVDGLKLYISMAEAERLKLLQSVKGADTTHSGVVRLYERLLPYAMGLGLEKTWLQELGKYYELDDVSSPDWISSTDAITAYNFVTLMNSVTSAATTNIYSTSGSSGSSSGFSGGGGGGFSGGGGGGGGTSGW